MTPVFQRMYSGTLLRRRRFIAGVLLSNLVWLLPLTMAANADDDPAAELRFQVTPPVVQLDGPESAVQVLVTQDFSDGRAVDWTSDARFETSDPSIAIVDERGLVEPRGDGVTTLLVHVGQRQLQVAIEVAGVARPAPISFRHEVIPVLTKSGCNSGGCHGKAEGQNGFRLSIFGFDADADYQALVQQSRGRRVNVAAPERSLLVQKAAALAPHGGGAAVARGSFAHRRLVRWIAEGARRDAALEPATTRIVVEPAERELALGAGRQQLRVIAMLADGRRRDVTAEAAYETNAPLIAEVAERGRVQGSNVPGEAAILVRYMGHVAVCRIRVPRPNVAFERPPEHNFIDRLVWDKLDEMGIQPASLADDATFLRRASLDVIGTLPTATEVRAFLDDPSADKRARWVDRLLERDEYATYWSLRWSDLLRVDANALGAPSSVAIVRWLRRQFEQNRPYDAMVRDLLTARGNLQAEGPAPLYATLDDPKQLASATSQLFLGVRIECAECHHHPFEKWSQRDFYALAGFFTGLKKKPLPGGAQALVLQTGHDLAHPRTGEVVPAAGLGASPVELPETAAPDAAPTSPIAVAANLDRRQALADWMTDDSNPFFARAIANRLWAHYFGRGLVEPVDDLRATNPATNAPLLDALADHLREVDYDLKAFTRTLLASRVYQLRSQPGDGGGESGEAAQEDPNQYFAHAAHRPLPAEVLLDAICQATDVPEKFNGWPIGARAIEVWDNRMPSYFFRIFGRPGRTTVCACERGDAPSITQALHLMNSPEIVGKVQHRHGRARRLAAASGTPAEIVNELYLVVLSRRPTEDEQSLLCALFDDPRIDRRTAVEDVLWTLLNTKEFLFNH